VRRLLPGESWGCHHPGEETACVLLSGTCAVERNKQRQRNRQGLAERVCDYIRSSGTALEYLNFSSTVMAHPEQVYPDVDLALTEGLLRIEGDKFISREIRVKAASLLAGKNISSRSHLSRVLAPLLLLRFSDRRSLPRLRRSFDDEKLAPPLPLPRASAIVHVSYGVSEFRAVRGSASRLMRNELATVVKLIERIRKYDDVPVRYKARLKPRYDSVSGTKCVDLRALLTVRLLRLASSARVARWISTWKASILAQSISPFDKGLSANCCREARNGSMVPRQLWLASFVRLN